MVDCGQHGEMGQKSNLLFADDSMLESLGKVLANWYLSVNEVVKVEGWVVC